MASFLNVKNKNGIKSNSLARDNNKKSKKNRPHNYRIDIIKEQQRLI
jgi:hypothetical protein